VADFTGGLAARRSPAPSVAIGVEAVGLIAIPVALLILPTRWDIEAMALTFIGGMVGGFGLILFYRAMALDLIGVVAPVTAVIAAALPTVVGVVVASERLHLGQAAGIAAGLVAIVLINSGGRASRKNARLGVALAVTAGMTFGLFFVLFHYASSAGVTAFVTGRIGSGVASVSYALATRVPVLPRRESLRLVGVAGSLDGLGVMLYMFATLYGLLSISALLTSFYPAFTILCARLVLHERLSATQAGGAALAVVAVAAIAAA
jgi:drug/metabolite transporter (DMT)-like permease